MRRSVSVRIATLLLVASLAAPAFASARTDDGSMGFFERIYSRVVSAITHVIHPTDMPVATPPIP
jgi:hypothetical protein